MRPSPHDEGMPQRQSFPPEMSSLLRQQAGVVSWEQAAALGVSRAVFRRLARDWTRIERGLYCAYEPGWHSALHAGLIRGGPEAVVGGAAAAHLHGLLLTRPTTLVIWRDATSCHRPPLRLGPWTVHYRRGVRVASRADPPVVGIADVLRDMAGTEEVPELVSAVLRALAKGLLSPEEIASAMDASPRRIRQSLLSRICSAQADGVESYLEWQYLTGVEQAHGLPTSTRQVWTSARTRCDVLYEEYGVVVELDGRQHDVQADSRRDNAHLVSRGWATLRYQPRDVLMRSCGTAREVARLLRHRGWEGDAQICLACQR